MKLLISSIVVMIFLQSCSLLPFTQGSGFSEKQFSDELNHLLDDYNLGNAYVGIYVERLDNRKVLYRTNEHKLFVPASNMKLYTSAASLIKFGRKYRFKTVFGTDSTRTDSTLNGNFIVRGMGDPSISGRFTDDDITAYFKNWADSLRAKGIHTINGNLIADNSYFSDDILADGWNWDDEPYWYSAQPSALSFNDNCVDFTIKPGRSPGDSLTIMQSPDINYLTVESNTVTSHSDSTPNLDITRSRAQNIALISGSLPAGNKGKKESISIEDPEVFFLMTLKNVLLQSGIDLKGSLEVASKRVSFRDTLFVHTSPELSELIIVLNKISHNFYAEQMIKSLGAEYGTEGSFDEGSEVISRWLHAIGVPPSEFIMVDGSGLSRKNFISPFATATLLRWMYYHPDFPVFYDSLPIAGVDGTLKNRMRHSPAQGRVHAKTGYVRHMRNLAGYALDKNDEPYVFVIMVNNYSVPTSYINELQNKICILLSNIN